MRRTIKACFAALAAALLLSAAVTSATANRLASNETGFRITYAPISFIPSFGSSITCPLTLEGSFHSRTLTKTAGSLIGYVNRAILGTCEAGRWRINSETLPWHLQYASFAGTLPNITAINYNLIRMSWDMQGEIFGLRVPCRYTTASEGFTNNRETTRGRVTTQRPGTESISSETEGCPSGRWSGTGNVVTPTGAASVVNLV